MFLLEKQNFLKISGFKMHHSSMTNYSNWPSFFVRDCNFCIIENNEVLWADFVGCGGGGSNNTYYNNTFNYCGISGMGVSGCGHRLINNETSYNNYRNFAIGWQAGGIKSVDFLRDTIMSGHIAKNNNGYGIWFDIACSNITVEKSISCNNTGSGIFYEISERGVIRNNISCNNKLRGIYISASSDCGVYHNLVYGNEWEGISVMDAGREWGYGEKWKTGSEK